MTKLVEYLFPQVLMKDTKINELVDQIIYSEIVSNDVKIIGWFHQLSEPFYQCDLHLLIDGFTCFILLHFQHLLWSSVFKAANSSVIFIILDPT